MLKKSKINKSPLVSVIMPVYNAGDFLVEAIESILKQTYKNIEFIIIDDSSTDNSWEIIKNFKKQYPKQIRAYRLKHTLNCGGDACANKGIERARGKYIARMDADDIAHPNRIKIQVDYMEKNKQTYLVGSNAYVINREGETIGEKLEPSAHEDIYRYYFTFHPIIHPTMMVRARVHEQKFSYQIKYNANNDYYTFFKLLCNNYRFANLTDKLLYYRIHGKNDTFVNMKSKFWNTLRIRILMVMKHGYNPYFKQILVTGVQTAVLFLLPEVITTRLYLLSKGIIKLPKPFILRSEKPQLAVRS